MGDQTRSSAARISKTRFTYTVAIQRRATFGTLKKHHRGGARRRIFCYNNSERSGFTREGYKGTNTVQLGTRSWTTTPTIPIHRSKVLYT